MCKFSSQDKTLEDRFDEQSNTDNYNKEYWFQQIIKSY